jgi:hypothetical protein
VAGETLAHRAILNRGNGVRTHVYRAPKNACRTCAHRGECAPQKSLRMGALYHSARGTRRDDLRPSGDRKRSTDIPPTTPTITDRRVSPWLD